MAPPTITNVRAAASVWSGVAGALLAVATANGQTQGPPPPLACLSRYYGVIPARTGGGWVATVRGGRQIPYDDGRTKTFDERLASPDLKDMFSPPYHKGPMRPVEGEENDPGRIRVEEIFVSKYGRTATEQDIISVPFGTHLVRFNRQAATALGRVNERLRKLVAVHPEMQVFWTSLGGTLARRRIAGTDRASAHSYGIAIDLNTAYSDYWRWQKSSQPLRWRNKFPQQIVDAFEAEGFIWGGRWYHFDTMHFEYRPELLDPGCRATPGRP
jgi:hypothetical protein